MPIISRHQKKLTIVDAIFTGLRLSSLITQTMERSSPAAAEAILMPAHTVFILSGNVILRNTGTRAAAGRMLIISETRLKVFSFLFSITIYLISFFPNCLTAIASTSTKTNIAIGRNGNMENVIVLDSTVKSCREQDTKYPL